MENIRVQRERTYRNRYEEARALAARYPEIAGYVPKAARFYELPSKNLLYFEALALAAVARDLTSGDQLGPMDHSS